MGGVREWTNILVPAWRVGKVLTGRTRTCSFFPHSTAMTAFALVRKSTRAGLTGRVALLALLSSGDGLIREGACAGRRSKRGRGGCVVGSRGALCTEAEAWRKGFWFWTCWASLAVVPAGGLV